VLNQFSIEDSESSTAHLTRLLSDPVCHCPRQV